MTVTAARCMRVAMCSAAVIASIAAAAFAAAPAAAQEAVPYGTRRQTPTTRCPWVCWPETVCSSAPSAPRVSAPTSR